MSVERSCEGCGGPFSARFGQRFCSAKCRYRARDARRDRAADNERSKAYYRTNRDEILERAKERRASKPSEMSEPSVRSCARCGEPTKSSRDYYCVACRPWARERRARLARERTRKRAQALRDRLEGA